MTRLREVIRHQETLVDIREIMNAMKNLAIIESRKLGKLLTSQREIVHEIDSIAADFIDHYPFNFQVNPDYHLYILIGAERGFSGNFNQLLQQRFHNLLQKSSDSKALTIAIGRKFAASFNTTSPEQMFLNGASATEEISHVLNQLVNQIEELQNHHGALACTLLRHDQLTRDILVQALLPPFNDNPADYHAEALPPLLYLAPDLFISELIQQYLFAHLYSALSASLLAENEFRAAHLDGAIRHLDERNVELGRLRSSC